MPKTLRGVVLALSLSAFTVIGVTPAAAQDNGNNKAKPAYEREYLGNYAEAFDRSERLGLQDPGCNLVTDKYDNKCKGKTTKQDVIKSNRTLETMLTVAPPPAPASNSPSTTTTATSAPSGGGCGNLPGYIVQRESGGNPNAVSPDGQYIGCAQVDTRHFGEWGTCTGIGYEACVNKLWDGGNGASNWPTAANPPR